MEEKLVGKLLVFIGVFVSCFHSIERYPVQPPIGPTLDSFIVILLDWRSYRATAVGRESWLALYRSGQLCSAGGQPDSQEDRAVTGPRHHSPVWESREWLLITALTGGCSATEFIISGDISTLAGCSRQQSPAQPYFLSSSNQSSIAAP